MANIMYNIRTTLLLYGSSRSALDTQQQIEFWLITMTNEIVYPYKIKPCHYSILL